MKKNIIAIEPVSKFIDRGYRLERTEIEYYEDGTSAMVEAWYSKK